MSKENESQRKKSAVRSKVPRANVSPDVNREAEFFRRVATVLESATPPTAADFEEMISMVAERLPDLLREVPPEMMMKRLGVAVVKAGSHVPIALVAELDEAWAVWDALPHGPISPPRADVIRAMDRVKAAQAAIFGAARQTVIDGRTENQG